MDNPTATCQTHNCVCSQYTGEINYNSITCFGCGCTKIYVYDVPFEPEYISDDEDEDSDDEF